LISFENKICLYSFFWIFFEVIINQLSEMKFIVNTNQLLNKLQSISGTIVSKPVIPILDHFLFDIQGSKLTITGTAPSFTANSWLVASHRAFDIIIDIVLKGSKNCTLSCGKYWIENKIPGNVLNIVTTYAWTGSGFVVPSATAKAGVLAMTRSLAVEWAKYGQRHNAIAPGPFPTKGAWDRLFPKEMSDKINLETRVPLKRVGEHQELANLAAYLMSDYSSYVNGEVVTIDGGEWLQGAGQFNQMDAITQEEWDILEKVVRSNQKKS
jgi:NAD(P)-dependent dehydrogenase (short-subunit alcohol dehydrogenase family)